MGTTGICKLCQNPERSKLVDSHIFPKWLYKEMFYDGKSHRYVAVSTEKEVKNRKGQGGFKESMLCSSCDNDIIGSYDDYGRRFIAGGTSLVIKKIRNDKIEVSEINYVMLKLFFLSVLWRASISKDIVFNEVTLGDKHEATLRSMLLSKKAGKYSHYPFIITFIEYNGDMFNGIIMSPNKQRLNGHRVYRFLFGGMLVVFGVPDFPNELLEFSLKENGSQVFPVRSADKIELITKFASIVTSQNKINR